jgi:hypothetical protein
MLCLRSSDLASGRYCAPGPRLYPWRSYVKLGGLLSYGIDLPDNYRRAALNADRILKGAKPNELPVQAPVKLNLIINLKTRKRSVSPCRKDSSYKPTS